MMYVVAFFLGMLFGIWVIALVSANGPDVEEVNPEMHTIKLTDDMWEEFCEWWVDKVDKDFAEIEKRRKNADKQGDA